MSFIFHLQSILETSKNTHEIWDLALANHMTTTVWCITVGLRSPRTWMSQPLYLQMERLQLVSDWAWVIMTEKKSTRCIDAMVSESIHSACHAFFSWLDYRNEEKGMFLNKTKQKIKKGRVYVLDVGFISFLAFRSLNFLFKSDDHRGYYFCYRYNNVTVTMIIFIVTVLISISSSSTMSS